jgi:hypothetical protein
VNANRPFQFQKRRQLLICPHNETLSIAAMRVNNPDWPTELPVTFESACE